MSKRFQFKLYPFSYSEDGVYRQKTVIALTDTYLGLIVKLTDYADRLNYMPTDKEADTMAWNPRRFLEWASSIGPACKRVIESELNNPRRQCVQQTYKNCMLILSLSTKHAKAELEEACVRIASLGEGSSYRKLKFVLDAKDSEDDDEYDE